MKKKSHQKSSSDFKSKNHVFGLIGLFLFLGFALSFMAVPQDDSITRESITGFATLQECIDGCGDNVACAEGCSSVSSGDTNFIISNIFNTLTGVLVGGPDQEMNQTYLKWTLFVMLSIFFFSIFSVVQWPGSRILMWLFALPLAFLSTALVSQTDVMASIQAYGAIGLTFITIIPLAIMFLFSSQLLQNKPTTGKIIFQLILWWYYLAFTFYVLIKYLLGNEAVGAFEPFTSVFWTNLIAVGGFPVIMITLSGLVALLVIISNEKFRSWVARLGRSLIKEVAEDTSAAAEAIRRAGGGGA